MDKVKIFANFAMLFFFLSYLVHFVTSKPTVVVKIIKQIYYLVFIKRNWCQRTFSIP